MLARRLLIVAAMIAVGLGFAAFIAETVYVGTGAPAPAPTESPEAPPPARAGGETCLSCHRGTAEAFAASAAVGSPHGRNHPGIPARGLVCETFGDDTFRRGREGPARGDPSPCGTDCERCHGPGAAHVDLRRRAPEGIRGRDRTIVNPARMIAGPRMHVCLECHLGLAGPPPGVERGRRPGGADSGDLSGLLRERAAARWKDAAGDQGARLMMSRCFRLSGAAIDCLTCHSVHGATGVGARAPGRFRRACLGCHGTDACALAEPERRALVAADDCTACHMGRAGRSARSRSGSTDHRIRR